MLQLQQHDYRDSPCNLPCQLHFATIYMISHTLAGAHAKDIYNHLCMKQKCQISKIIKWSNQSYLGTQLRSTRYGSPTWDHQRYASRLKKTNKQWKRIPSALFVSSRCLRKSLYCQKRLKQKLDHLVDLAVASLH